MAIICRACKELIPEEAAFCGYCGFKLAPLVVHEESAPILLTKVKQQRRAENHSAAAAAQDVSASSAGCGDGSIEQREARAVELRQPTAAASSSVVVDASLREPPAPPRRARRFPLKVDVTCNSEHNFYTGFLENISEGGLFIATHTPARIGDEFEVTFTVPGIERACSVLCCVRWLREYDPLDPQSVPGMGCQFFSLEPRVAVAIEAFFRHREPLFFD